MSKLLDVYTILSAASTKSIFSTSEFSSDETLKNIKHILSNITYCHHTATKNCSVRYCTTFIDLFSHKT